MQACNFISVPCDALVSFLTCVIQINCTRQSSYHDAPGAAAAAALLLATLASCGHTSVVAQPMPAGILLLLVRRPIEAAPL